MSMEFSCSLIPTSATTLSLHSEMEKSLKNLSLNGLSSSQASFQNFTLLPSPIIHLILLSNQLSKDLLPHTFARSRHHYDCFGFTAFISNSVQVPYRDSKISLYRTYSCPQVSTSTNKKASLNMLMSLIPNPPASSSRHTFSELTHIIFLSSELHPQKFSLQF